MLILRFVLLLTGVSAQCFCKEQNEVEPNSSVCDRGNGIGPCGPPSSTDTGFVHCCHPGDTCGAHGFCHFRRSLVGTSQYYLGGCTDPTFVDPSCSRQCIDFSSQDVVYNSSSGLWSCYWNNAIGAPDCSDPTNETFYAPSPDDLFTASWASVTAVSSIPTDSRTTTQVSTSMESNTSAQESTPISRSSSISSAASPTQLQVEATAGVSSDLSTGAKAGIGGGISAAFIVGIGALLFFLRRRRRNHHRCVEQPNNHHQYVEQPNAQQNTPHEMSAAQRYEAPSDHHPIHRDNKVELAT